MFSIKVYINKLTVPPTLMVNLVGPNPLNLCLAQNKPTNLYTVQCFEYLKYQLLTYSIEFEMLF